MHLWERKRRGSQTRLREMTGDMAKSKIRGKEVRKCSWRGGSGEPKRDLEERE